MKRRQPYRDGKVHVLRVQCATCIFRPGNPMHLRPGRVKRMVQECLDAGTAIVCHDTLDGGRALCRGFVDRYADRVAVLRLLRGSPEALQEVDPP